MGEKFNCNGSLISQSTKSTMVTTQSETAKTQPDNNITHNVCSTNNNSSEDSTKKTEWTRIKPKGLYHDNRRLLKHRAKNCECFVCYREIHKLPPAETHEEYVSKIKADIAQREIKRATKKAKSDIKSGKQKIISIFFEKI